MGIRITIKGTHGCQIVSDLVIAPLTEAILSFKYFREISWCSRSMSRSKPRDYALERRLLPVCSAN